MNIPKNILCFSHLRWDFVYQRPQHLLSRFANNSHVYFIEEPIFDAHGKPEISISLREDKLWVVVPHLQAGLKPDAVNKQLSQLLEKNLQYRNMEDFAFWYYTPMALQFSAQFHPKLVIYDCMDELSAFKNAPKKLKELEKQLLIKADIVFTGGHSLYDAKKDQHSNIYPFPSSIDKSHFAKARNIKKHPADQACLAGPKMGFYGVIDERFDIELIKGIADQRPQWQIMLIGPVVKIDPASLPKNSNIHYLGAKSYADLPSYLGGWDVALIPFMLNDSTRFISPTKTPEYLSAGKPVVSTPIRDVINPYGLSGLVHICKTADDFIIAIEQELQKEADVAWIKKTEKFLKKTSWNDTHQAMVKMIQKTLIHKNKLSIAS